MKTRILIADDQKQHRNALAVLLEDWGYESIQANNGKEAVAMCEEFAPAIVLLDGRMPIMDGYQALAQIHNNHPEIAIIMMTAYSEVPKAVEAMRMGACDYLPKPLDFQQLKILIRNLADGLSQKKAIVTPEISKDKVRLLGASPPIQALNDLIATVAPTDATVLITGESGVGKELAARSLHDISKRSSGPFVAINCGAMTESLLASELFGYEKGAFTGADKKHEGLFLQAKGGSLFLDEVGEMPPAMQVKLLRVLQEREVLSIGSTQPKAVDCRIIAATNRDLSEEVMAGRFREDLFYRLNVVALQVPPLRERGNDIILLAEFFANKFANANAKKFTGITADAKSYLLNYSWPGNARELANTMERAIILMHGEQIDARTLPDSILYKSPLLPMRAHDLPISNKDSIPTLDDVERSVILTTLARLGNNKTETAKALGITRKTLHSKLNRYKI